MGMALPEKPPLMMVESAALNEAEEKEGRSGKGHSHGPVFHTRGLTLTVEYRKIQQVVTRDGRRFTQPVDLSARDRFEVGPNLSSCDIPCQQSLLELCCISLFLVPDCLVCLHTFTGLRTS